MMHKIIKMQMETTLQQHRGSEKSRRGLGQFFVHSRHSGTPDEGHGIFPFIETAYAFNDYVTRYTFYALPLPFFMPVEDGSVFGCKNEPF